MDTRHGRPVAPGFWGLRNLCRLGRVYMRAYPQDTDVTRFRIALILGAAITLMLSTAAPRAAALTGDEIIGRQLVLRYLHEVDCGFAAMAAFPESQARFEARMQKRVPPSQQYAERTARMQALARRSSGCEHVKHQVRDVSIQFDPNTNALLQQAADAGDRFAQLNYVSLAMDDAAGADHARAQLYEVVQSGDALAISEIGMKLARSRDPAHFGSTFRPGDSAAVFVWMLVGCDLGLECGPGSREHDRWCLRYGGGCAQANLAGAMRLVLGDPYFNQIDAQRRVLVERIRNRQWEGLFAPLVNTTDATSS
jgi:hypothetical protein